MTEISPGSWEYRLVAATVYAVEQRAGGAAGGPRTRWNGKLLEETDPTALGGAHPDGSMSVSVTNVLEPLRKAKDLDRPLTSGEAWQLRDAMATLTHESAHLMARLGDMSAPDAYPYDDAAAAYDEGRTEHWTHRNVDKVIGDVFIDAGLDKVQDAVLAQPNLDAYPAYTPAVRHLDEAIAQRSGLTSAQVTQTLMRADDSQRWNVAVDMVIDNRLSETGLMPEADRADVRRQLVTPLRASLGHLGAVQADDTLGSVQKSDEAMKAALSATSGLDQELDRIERRYQVENAQRSQQEAQRPTSRLSQAVRQAQQQQLPPDLKRLQTLTDAQAPAADATKQRPAAGDRAQSPTATATRPRGQQTDRPKPTGPDKPQSPERG